MRYWLLCFGVVCQLATIVITWEVWQARKSPPNIPLFDLPPIAFGWLAVLSLLAVLVWPLYGVVAHAAVVAVACVFDQYRLQPQFIALIVLMWACVGDVGLWFGRWYLATMWFWAGAHKLLSPEWMGSSSWWYLEQCGISPAPWHLPFALSVGVAEIALGIVGMFRPRMAAPWCAVLHGGVLVSLSPLIRNFNPSVWPWNIASAVIGYWILRSRQPQLSGRWSWLVPATLLIVPAGFYFDLVNPHLASVLYSGNMPRAYQTSPSGVHRLDGWGKLRVPFPDSPRLLVRNFELSGTVGDKLYLQDPRPWLGDGFFVLTENRQAQPISRERFLKASAGERAGVEMADPEVVWRLKRAGVGMTLLRGGTLYSATAAGDGPAATLCRELPHIHNLHELKIDDARLPADALVEAEQLPKLEIVELSGCEAPPGMLAEIVRLKGLRFLRWESMSLPLQVARELSSLERLEVLRLPFTSAGDDLLVVLAPMPSITWLDLQYTNVTDEGMLHLRKFPACTWLNLCATQISSKGLTSLDWLLNLEIVELAKTQISDEGLASLAPLAKLEILNLEDTPISDRAVEHLKRLRSLKQLNLRGTQVTAAGAGRLARELPACTIVR